MDLKHIDATFQNLQDDAGKAYQKVYADIRSQLKGSNSRGLGGEIARLEATRVSAHTGNQASDLHPQSAHGRRCCTRYPSAYRILHR